MPPPSAAASPTDVAWTTFSVTWLRSTSSGASTSRPPPKATASVPAAPTCDSARLPVILVSRMTDRGWDRPQHRATWTPPAIATRSSPNPAGGPDTSALLPLTTLSSIVSVPSESTPPMPANCPFGAVAIARFPLTTVRRRTSVETRRLLMPPAVIPLASVPSVDVDPAVLFVISESVIVSTPPLSIPPPALNPQGSGPQNTNGGIVERDITWFPVITLWSIVTVAPVPLNGGVGSCDVGIQIPPPNVTSGSGCESLTPPVIVRPLIETVSPAASCSRKMVRTGPPPDTTLAFEPAPTMATLLSIVTPPANVPFPTWIVSPSCDAATAACSVA